MTRILGIEADAISVVFTRRELCALANVLNRLERDALREVAKRVWGEETMGRTQDSYTYAEFYLRQFCDAADKIDQEWGMDCAERHAPSRLFGPAILGIPQGKLEETQ